MRLLVRGIIIILNEVVNLNFAKSPLSKYLVIKYHFELGGFNFNECVVCRGFG
jgi:hypothetical protein